MAVIHMLVYFATMNTLAKSSRQLQYLFSWVRKIRVHTVLSLSENADDLCHPHYNYEIPCGSFVQWKLSDTVSFQTNDPQHICNCNEDDISHLIFCQWQYFFYPVLSDEGVFRVEEVLSLAENGDDLCHPHYNYEICCGSFVQWKLSDTVRNC